MSAQAMLQELAFEVRSLTLRMLDSAEDAALLWAPPPLQNHITWRSGHALWLQDLMCVQPLSAGGKSELPSDWGETFGQYCRPPNLTEHWPSREELVRLLSRQLDRMIELLQRVTDQQLAGPPPPRMLGRSRTLGGWIIHGLHDEAMHSGESYLALKMLRAMPT